ncbi:MULTISPECIES: IS630 family transposase [unclassified Amycolatopsis]|uniref:IS630 family transposase n=1 Tax=unclassified Amycolatopsis TaxID=2618356 RepID=UPI0028741CA9|nr:MULTISPECIES: IS630 family transposase [unclassified Amycolatopsis]MDS0133561.1 IS630 family transposase [Amycolatopsis sp. 505]MDS0148594.1 IS630 family transposase [Amycolatopsis sp. CM201R]
MPSSKLAPLVLSDEERRVLEGWSRRRATAQGLAMRARIVLTCAEGGSSTEVSERLQLNRSTVATWRARFVRDRLDGLSDEPRPGRPRTITDDQVEHAVVTTLETKPANATHWSTRSLAAQVGMTQSAVSRIWRAFGLKPHKVDTFKISKDPLFVDKVRDVVGLYLDPPAKAVVLCVDEKTQIQALDRSAPMLPGVPERQSFDYVRHGTTSLFAALEVATGQVISAVKRRHRHQEFLAFLRTIDKTVPTELDVHVILDNLSTHKTPAVKSWLLKHPRFHLHFTPTSSSWLNLVERFFSEITVKLFRRGVHRSVSALEKDIRGWIEQWNTNPKPYVWTRTADQILESLAAYCHRITDSGH